MIEILSFVEANSILSAIIAGLVVAAIVGAVGFVRRNRQADSKEASNQTIVVKGKGNLVNVVDAASLQALHVSLGFEQMLPDNNEHPDFFCSDWFEGIQSRYVEYDREILIAKRGEEGIHANILGLSFDCDPYIVNVGIDYYLNDEAGEYELVVYGEKEKSRRVGILSGQLILGYQMFSDERDFWVQCDNLSGDLEAVASLLSSANLLYTEYGFYRNVFYIESIELSSDMIESSGVNVIFETIPQVVYEKYNVKPDLLCYLIASNENYYENAKDKSQLDSRSVDEKSPILFLRNGFAFAGASDLLYKKTEGIHLPII